MSRAGFGGAPGKERQDARRQPEPLAPNDPRHGTVNGYQNRHCRCERCRRAWSSYHKAWLHRNGYHTPIEDFLYQKRLRAELRDNHGTEVRYKLGCRCEECKAGAADARRARRLTPNVTVHSYSGYSNGCRCDVCREGHRINTAKKRARAASADVGRSVADSASKSGGG